MTKKSRSILLVIMVTLGFCAGCEKEPNEDPFTGEAVNIWSTYNTVKVVQNSEQAEYVNLPAQFSVQMMKNETEGAQLILSANTDVRHYKLTAAKLSDGKGNEIALDQIKIYAQKYALISKKVSKNQTFSAGDYIPDMLLPMEKSVEYNENHIAKGKNQGITVEITTTSETVPGIYTGNFTLEVDGKSQEIPVSVEVWDIEYEGRRTFMTSFFLYRNHLLYGEYNNSKELVDSYIDFLLDYKMNVYVIKDSYPVDEFITDVKWQYESNNFNSICIPYNFPLSFTTYDASGSPTTQAKAVLQFIKELAKASTAETPYIEHAYLNPTNVDEADWDPDKKMQPAINMMEPGGEFDQLLELAVMELEAEGYFKTLDTITAERFRNAILTMPEIFTNVGFIDEIVGDLGSTFCPYISNFDDAIQVGKYQESAEKLANGNLWTYTCSGPVYPYPSFHVDDYNLGTRISGWMEKAYNINGYLYWAVSKYGGSNGYVDVYTDPLRAAGTNGDGFLLYPGKYYGSDKPFASTRLATWRDSMDDYDMLCVLENLLNGYAEKYGFEQINVNDYVADIYDSIFTGATYYTDDSLVYKAREELAKRILALKNGDDLLALTTYNGNQATTEIYTTSSSLCVDGVMVEGVACRGGYKYTIVNPVTVAKTLLLKTDNGEYTHIVKAGGQVADFGDSTQKILVSDTSTVSLSENKANVTIKSVIKSAGGQIDGATKRFRPFVSFGTKDLSGAKNVFFSLKNTGETNIEAYIEVVLNNGMVYEIGSVYLPSNESKEVRVHISEALEIDSSQITDMRLSFANVITDANGWSVLWADRCFEISNIRFERNA